jgi:prepilin signal peptidase PulO-like enzyme (type II secretory pathway)
MANPGPCFWPAVGWAVAFNLLLDWNSAGFGNNIWNSLTFSGVLAAFLAFIFFFLMVVASKEKWMGMGDAYLVILLGLIAGWPGILLALMLAFSAGAILGIILIVLKRKKLESQIPFAPFLVLERSSAIFIQISNWYFSLLSFRCAIFTRIN